MLEVEKCAAQRDAGRQIRGMNGESRAAHVHRLFELSCAAVLFGELRESDRRRVLLDPSSEIFETRIVSHRYGTTVTVWAADVLLARVTVSMTFRVAEYEPAPAST